jgi:hypothetical protein
VERDGAASWCREVEDGGGSLAGQSGVAVACSGGLRRTTPAPRGEQRSGRAGRGGYSGDGAASSRAVQECEGGTAAAQPVVVGGVAQAEPGVGAEYGPDTNQ